MHLDERFRMTVDEFWDWSLARYSDQPTRDYLLTLQAELDLVVLEALFAMWLGSRHREWGEGAADRLGKATQRWLEAVVSPLRETRVRWRSDPTLQTAREHLLTLEVQAERHLAELIWDAVMGSSDVTTDVVYRPEVATAELMTVNVGRIPLFRDGKYVSERTQMVVLLDQAT
jgi:uncharacterized protein (TIGR02444 family)